MRLAAYSFAAGPDMEQNLAAIRRGVQQTSQAGARLLALPECALCGYPPVETPGSASIRPEDLERGFAAWPPWHGSRPCTCLPVPCAIAKACATTAPCSLVRTVPCWARTTSAPSGAGTWTTSPGASSRRFRRGRPAHRDEDLL